VKKVAEVTSYALYAPPGYLLYLDQQTLVARAFNARTLDFTGPPLKVAENVGYGFFSVSATGLLAYAPWSGTFNDQMAWFNREGQKLGTLGPPGAYTAPTLSPDGTRVAVDVGMTHKRDIWVFETKRGTASRLTFEPADNFDAAWSADGRRILFSSDRNGQIDIYQKDANGLGTTQPVFQSKDQTKDLDDLSADGRYAIYDNAGSSTSKQLWALPLFGERKPFVFVEGAFGALSAQFSPNGRYVAYASNETGRLEIYVETFPQQSGKWEVSTSGGAEPMWRRDGKELFYLTLDQRLMAVDVNTTAPGFKVGIPKELFQAQLMPIAYWRNFYVASPDGQRFLMVVPASDAKPAPITVVVNWPALLKK
jgi:eukaryotic-like serine/threonine-protein kinase